MNCPSCGAGLEVSARFCGSCGQTFRETRASPDTRPPSSSAMVRTPGSLAPMDLVGAGFQASKPVLGTFIVGMILLSFASILFMLTIVGFFALPALYSGTVVVALLAAAGRPVAIGDFFKGLKLFVPILLLGIVSGFLTQLGFYLLFLPGLYLTFVWMLAPFVMIDRGLEFWPAMEMSREAVHAHLGEVVLFCIALFAVNLVLAIPTLGLSMIVTGPVSLVATAVLYDRLIGIEGGAERL